MARLLLLVHVFSDASKVGLGTCVFLRCRTGEEIDVRFVAAKARVAPIEEMTIPRKELLAAGLAARLGSTVLKTILFTACTYWCDSMVVLYWIKKGEWKVFVGNRVKEIRQLTQADMWRFVPGEMNPADLLSRGSTLTDFSGKNGGRAPNDYACPPMNGHIVK